MAKQNIVIDTGSSRTVAGEPATGKPDSAGTSQRGKDEALKGDNIPEKDEVIKSGIGDEETHLEDGKTVKPIIKDGEESPTPKPPVSEEVMQIDGTDYKVDTYGNAVDARGNIFKTKEEIALLKEAKPKGDETQKGTVIEIDKVDYTIDDNGNAVNDKGEIAFTSEQLNSMESAEEVDSFDIKKLQDETKVIVYDNNGQPVEYENKPESLATYISDGYDQGRRDGAKDGFDNLIGQFPVLNSVLNHLQLHNGSLDNFNASVDYKAIELVKDNETQLLGMIKSGRKLRGEDDARIQAYIDFIKSTDSSGDALLKEANAEKEFMTGVENERLQREQTAINAREQNEVQKLQEYWGYSVDDANRIVDLNVEGSVYNYIRSGEVKLSDKEIFTIPDKIRRNENGKPVVRSRDDFFDYLTIPQNYVINNQKVTMTPNDYDIYQEDNSRHIGHDMVDAFKRYVGYDISSFIRDEVGKEEVNRVKRRLTSGKAPKGNKTKPTAKKKIIIKTI